MLLVFTFTLFASATLLFTVEPMIGKMILPLLGGTPAVWNTCMVFFQAVLLAGYAYAHFSTTWLGARKQAVLHLILLALPFVFLPLEINKDLIKSVQNPVLALLLLLSVTVGVPMFVVCVTLLCCRNGLPARRIPPRRSLLPLWRQQSRQYAGADRLSYPGGA